MGCNRNLTVKEAVRAPAQTLERIKKRGFDTQSLAKKLHEKGIEIKPPTLAKYMNEFRRWKDRKTDTPRSPKPDRPVTVNSGGFTITPDTLRKTYNLGA